MKNFDVVIVGAGIIGCSLARSLASNGMRVGVIERGAPGEEASWAAAGMLAPSAEAQAGSVLFPACRASLKLYASFVAELQAETGIDSQYRTEGTLLLYENEGERETMLESVEWQRQQGIPIQELSTQDLHNTEPELAPCPGGFYLPEDYQVDNRLLMRALIQSCKTRGVRFLLGEGAREVQHNGTMVNGVLVGANNITAPRVVNTAGAWAGGIGVPGRRSAPIRPVKGHMIALANPQPPLRHVVRTHRVYLVPRRNGSVMVGSTMEEAGFDKTPRAGPIAKLLRAAQHLCPVLEQSTISEFWAGLRPAAPDGLPVLGPSSLDGYWLATGHFRNGILLTPITAQILSSWLLTGSSSFAVDALLPKRFENNSKQ